MINEINRNYLENKMKKPMLKIRVDIPININNNIDNEQNDKIYYNKLLFNEIKNLLTQDIKFENKKEIQTFLAFP